MNITNLTILKLFGMAAWKPCVGKSDFRRLVNWPCMNVVDINCGDSGLTYFSAPDVSSCLSHPFDDFALSQNIVMLLI